MLQPVFLDPATGDLFADPGVGGDDSGAFLRRSPAGLARRARRAESRAAARRARAAVLFDEDEDDDVMPQARSSLVESYRLAGAANLINADQFDGLGFTTIAASATGTLTDTLNRQFWAKSLCLDSDDPASLVVTAVSVAGIPINVGSLGAPLSLWSRDSTRFSTTLGRRAISVGQQFRVSLQNIDAGSGHQVSGVIIGDELMPGIAQQAMEKVVIEAALALSDVGYRG